MEEIKSYYEVVKLLEECRTLVYKSLNSKITYLTLINNNRIAVINDNLHYNISFDDLKDLMKTTKIFIYDQES